VDWADELALRVRGAGPQDPVGLSRRSGRCRGGCAEAPGLGSATLTDRGIRRDRHTSAQVERRHLDVGTLNARAQQQGTTRFTSGARQLYRWHQGTDLGFCPYLQGGTGGPACTDESTLDYASCVKLCHERNLGIFAVILMQDEQRSLVRMFAPGLRSTKPRFGPGRLYSVPAILGLTPAGSICRDPFPF